jgi:PRC-barrel domain
MNATALRKSSLVSSEDVQGTQVYDESGNSIGSIDHLMIDKVSGKVLYAVMSFGGFLGLGHSHYPLPWGKLNYDTSLDGFRTDVTENQLRDAPEYSDDAWRNREWETRVHRHYSVPPYWMG